MLKVRGNRIDQAEIEQARIGLADVVHVAVTTFERAEGVLSLDDAVDTHLPQYDFGPKLTVRSCLNHTSGLFNYTDDPLFLERVREELSPEQVVAFALEHPPVFEPGQGWSYSNTNYYLLALVAQKVTGENWAHLVRQRLLIPRDLPRTWMEPEGSHVGVRAQAVRIPAACSLRL